MFPDPTFGEFINKDYIILKMDLDKGSYDDFQKIYSIKSFPTFVFFNGDKQEITRFSGASSKEGALIEKIKEVMEPTNSWFVFEKNFKDDVNTVDVYLEKLFGVQDTNKAQQVALEAFNRMSAEQKFSEKSLDLWKKAISSEKSELYKILIDNYKQGSNVVGKKEYTAYLSSIFRNIVYSSMMRKYTANDKRLEGFRQMYDENKLLKSTVTDYMITNYREIETDKKLNIGEMCYQLAKNMTDSERDFAYSTFRSKSERLYEVADYIVTFDKREAEVEAFKAKIEKVKNTLTFAEKIKQMTETRKKMEEAGQK